MNHIFRTPSRIFFTFLIHASAYITLALVLGIIGIIMYKGISGISFSFFFSKMQNFGASGGIRDSILGSIALMFGTAAFTLPLSLFTAIFYDQYIKSTFLKKCIGGTIMSLNGVPSIVFGLFGLIFFVHLLHFEVSLITGICILSIMILPTVTNSIHQGLQSTPKDLIENGYALGMTKEQVIFTILLPYIIPEILTGLFLGMSRAIGETAPIMFTATVVSSFGSSISLFQPVSTLPTHILFLSQNASNPQSLQNAWSTSLTLLFLVIFSGIIVVYFRKKHISKCC